MNDANSSLKVRHSLNMFNNFGVDEPSSFWAYEITIQYTFYGLMSGRKDVLWTLSCCDFIDERNWFALSNLFGLALTEITLKMYTDSNAQLEI